MRKDQESKGRKNETNLDRFFAFVVAVSGLLFVAAVSKYAVEYRNNFWYGPSHFSKNRTPADKRTA